MKIDPDEARAAELSFTAAGGNSPLKRGPAERVVIHTGHGYQIAWSQWVKRREGWDNDYICFGPYYATEGEAKGALAELERVSPTPKVGDSQGEVLARRSANLEASARRFNEEAPGELPTWARHELAHIQGLIDRMDQ